MSLLDLTSTIESLSTGTYTVTRRAAGTVSGGKVTLGQTSTFSIQAAVLPAEPEALQRLPEGTRLDDVRVIYSATPVLPGNETTGAPADRISIDGKNFEVEAASDYQMSGAFTKALARRVDPA